MIRALLFQPAHLTRLFCMRPRIADTSVRMRQLVLTTLMLLFRAAILVLPTSNIHAPLVLLLLQNSIATQPTLTLARTNTSILSFDCSFFRSFVCLFVHSTKRANSQRAYCAQSAHTWQRNKMLVCILLTFMKATGNFCPAVARRAWCAVRENNILSFAHLVVVVVVVVVSVQTR